MMVDRADPALRPSSRVLSWVAAATALVAAAAIYTPVVAGLGRQWYDDPSAAYGAVVFLAGAFALLQRWPHLRGIPAEGSPWGVAALILASSFYVAGTLAADVYILRVSLIAFAVATVWFLCGAAHVRALAVPLGLLLISIPLPATIVTELTMPLQLAASRCAAGLLGWMGIAVARDGNLLTLNYITLEVAEACNGMRSLVTLLALVAVYGAACGITARRVLLLAVAAVPVALAGNGLRVAFTAVLASRIGEGAVRGLVHDATGWAAFVVMCAALAGLHALATWCGRVREAAV